MATPREVRRHRWQISLCAHMHDQVHADDNVEHEVTMEEPVARIIGTETQDHVSVVGHSNRVLQGRLCKVTMQKTSSIQVQSVLQVDFLDVGIRRTSHSDDVESVAVQMEGVTEIGLLDFVNQDNLYDGIQRDVDGVGAHAVLGAVWWTVVTVAELLWWYVLDLGQQRGWG